MKLTKQTTLWTIFALLVIIAGVGLYLFQQNRQAEEVIPAEEISESEEEVALKERTIDDEFYSTLVPAGWVEATLENSKFLSVVIKPIGDIESQDINDVAYDTYYAVNNTALIEDGLERYVELLLENLIIQNPSIEVINQYPSTISERDAICLEIASISDEQDYKTLLVFIDDSEWVWALSFNTPALSWEENQNIFDSVLESFLIK